MLSIVCCLYEIILVNKINNQIGFRFYKKRNKLIQSNINYSGLLIADELEIKIVDKYLIFKHSNTMLYQ